MKKEELFPVIPKIENPEQAWKIMLRLKKRCQYLFHSFQIQKLQAVPIHKKTQNFRCGFSFCGERGSDTL